MCRSPAYPLTVVMPTYQRPESALRAIRSLQQQDGDLELLVVDNAASIALRDAIDAVNIGARIPATWIPEPQLGLHHARHTGAKLAKSDLIAFTDDDTTFAPGWAGAYAEAFSAHPDMIAAGGPSIADWDAVPPKWLHDWVAGQESCYQLSVRDLGPEFRLGPSELFWGVNMAIRRNALFAAGGFNPECFGDVWLGDGETGLFDKLREQGAVFGYVPNARVNHHIPPSRMTIQYLRKRMRNEGASEAYGLLREHRRSSTLGLVAPALGWMLAAAEAWLIALPFRGGRGNLSLRAQLRAARCTGRVAYAYAALRDMKLRQLILRDNWLTT